VDEERKINVNRCDLQTLTLLFMNLCLDEAEAQNYAASIIDWRDSDSLLTLPGSAESSYYEGLSEPYQAKNGDFESLEELLLVKGMTQELFDKMKDYVTIYTDGKININTASGRVLNCLGLSKPVVSKIISFRYGVDGLMGTNDDGVFVSPETVVAQLSQSTQLSDSEVNELSNLAASGAIVTTSNYFMIKSVASLGNNDARLQSIVCVVKRTGEILSYVEF
jgi:type II secretory pathway component PulK